MFPHFLLTIATLLFCCFLSLSPSSTSAYHQHHQVPQQTVCSLNSNFNVTWQQSPSVSTISINDNFLSFNASQVFNLVAAKWDVFTANGNYNISNKIFARSPLRVDSLTSLPSSSSSVCVLDLVSDQLNLHFNLTFQVKTTTTATMVNNKEYISYSLLQSMTSSSSSLSSNSIYQAIELPSWSLPDSTSAILGMGEQYNSLDLRYTNENKKRTDPVVVFTREQGVGRGQEPITDIINAFSGQFAGGSVQTNYATRPLLQTHKGWVFQMLQPSSYSEWYFTAEAGKFTVLVNKSAVRVNNDANNHNNSPVVLLSGNIAQCAGLKESTQLSTRLVYEFYQATKMKNKNNKSKNRRILSSLNKNTNNNNNNNNMFLMPPAYSYYAAIIGMQGGTAAVLSNFTALRALDCPIGSFWLQDWTGQRPLDNRKGLWWSWGRWNSKHYPNINSMITNLTANGNVRTLVYVNPMLVNASGVDGMDEFNPWQTAFDNDFFVTDRATKKPYTFYNGASLIDFTNPSAREWFVDLMVKSVTAAGMDVASSVSFGMTDFGEAMSISEDAVLFDKSIDPKEYHNEYPDKWFEVVRDAAEKLDSMLRSSNSSSSSSSSYLSDTYFSFGRSAWLGSSFEYNAAWSGDQLCDFSNFDGLGSAVVSQLTSGLSGTILQHSDIGGYNQMLYYHRTEELFYRWCEFAAFTSFFRTHDGSNPEANFQFYRTEIGRKNFVRYAKMFAAWLPLRKSLIADAARTGVPVSRPMIFEYNVDESTLESFACPFPSSSSSATTTTTSSSPDSVFCNNFKQYIIGNKDLLVVPVLEKGVSSVDVYFPSEGSINPSVWINLLTQKTYTSSSSAQLISVPANIGCPAVFVNAESKFANVLLASFSELRDQC